MERVHIAKQGPLCDPKFAAAQTIPFNHQSSFCVRSGKESWGLRVSRLIFSCGLLAVSGCVNLDQIYVHDVENAAAALRAQEAFDGAGSDALWTNR